MTWDCLSQCVCDMGFFVTVCVRDLFLFCFVLITVCVCDLGLFLTVTQVHCLPSRACRQSLHAS